MLYNYKIENNNIIHVYCTSMHWFVYLCAYGIALLGWGEEIGTSEGNQYRHRENMQIVPKLGIKPMK